MGSGAASAGEHFLTEGTRVRDVVRDVVARVAPEELPLVEALARFDDATVVRRLGRRGGRREPLGFGLGEIAAMAAPVVWLVVDETARQIAAAVATSATTGTRTVIRRLLRRPDAPVTVPELTREQLAEIHRRVVESAVQRGLGDERAATIADAVVARLALAGPGEEAQGPPGPESAAGSGTPAQG
ncbi:hypothetical protein [Streptomyces sp. C36]|uniref:hypothetical protein n=1 Tax=Streptomyces sp. C36 TaxID=3237122 RepID=UPI0034C63EF0